MPWVGVRVEFRVHPRSVAACRLLNCHRFKLEKESRPSRNPGGRSRSLPRMRQPCEMTAHFVNLPRGGKSQPFLVCSVHGCSDDDCSGEVYSSRFSRTRLQVPRSGFRYSSETYPQFSSMCPGCSHLLDNPHLPSCVVVSLFLCSTMCELN